MITFWHDCRLFRDELGPAISAIYSTRERVAGNSRVTLGYEAARKMLEPRMRKNLKKASQAKLGVNQRACL